jgi:hypothetical protein
MHRSAQLRGAFSLVFREERVTRQATITTMEIRWEARHYGVLDYTFTLPMSFSTSARSLQ